jgi:transposase
MEQDYVAGAEVGPRSAVWGKRKRIKLSGRNSHDGALKPRCTTGPERRVRRWEHEAVIEAMQERLDRKPDAMHIRKSTVEHAFGTLKAWMGATHFKTRTLEKVRTEMSLHVLAYNLKRVMAIMGVGPLIQAMQA